MRGWLGDLFRTIGALWVWNLRKTLYVARGRRGDCPCHNPSDSGHPLETRCEAVTYWREARRFSRRVCPLLTEVEPGRWRCRARPAEVRPFWGRWFGWHFGTVGGAVLAAGLALFVTMRVVGFDVSLRQIFWPHAWTELRGVRAAFFRQQAQELISAGRFREAASALRVAYDLDSRNYEAGLALAEFYQIGRPELVDGLYRHLMRLHPEQRAETAQRWLRSLLARGDLAGVAELAKTRLAGARTDAPAWGQALAFSARMLRQPDLLEAAAAEPGVSPSMAAALAMEARVRGAERTSAVALLLREPLPEDSGFARVQRIELLLEYSEGLEALEWLRSGRAEMAGRDVARLTLAAHATMRNRAALERDIRALLGPEQQQSGANGLAVVALHLIRYPDPALLNLCLQSLPAEGAANDVARDRALAAVYCAAFFGNRRDQLPLIRAQMSDQTGAGTLTLEEALARGNWSPALLLSLVKPMSLELQYAIVERLFRDSGAAVR